MMQLTLNGVLVQTEAHPAMRLVDFLRCEMGMTGTREGCGKGECGACSVWLDGKVVNSCLVLLGQCEGRDVRTIEGIAQNDKLHPVQQAMLETGAVQCGFCTPGIVMAATAMLRENPEPNAQDVRVAIEGNLCRCTGYCAVETAILQAAKEAQR